jgi:hypothetical protein
VAIVRDPADQVAASRPARWAAEELAAALRVRGVSVATFERLEAAPAGTTRVMLSGLGSPATLSMLARAGAVAPAGAEALAVVPTQHAGQEVLLAAGRDPLGLVYATLELADRARTAGADPVAALRPAQPIVQQPANPIRGVARLFTSDVEDKGWYYDRDFWRGYLSMLVAQRFNRIHLAFGIGHDFLRNVLDAYLLFAYPFLVDVPGYAVRVPGLSDSERQQNLDALRFASDEAAARGLHFQLGIWTQAYAWVDSPNANYVIEGLTSDNHAAYCRDAIRAVLEACPSIAGVTFRVHGESGVPEGNYDFWREVFRGVVAAGRRVELDLHPKGVGQEMIDVALETGLPVKLSPKYTAEHMGLPGHQVAIRELERDASAHDGDAFVQNLMNQSAGTLRYTRYGNADFLKEDRAYGIFYRLWPGTQRLLLWGDPVLAAGFGRHSTFCGSQGIELCEPLSFKGRRGSGLAGGRSAYSDPDLANYGNNDFEKYLYTYRLFGRLLYDPNEDPGVWQRALAHEFGPAAEALETALANASRILPLVTSAQHPSAANNRFWPEIYTNMPIVDGGDHPYRDTPQPSRLGNVSPLDPGLFASIEDFVRETVNEAGEPSGRVSPLRVATRLDELAATASRALDEAVRQVADASTPGFRRAAIDVAIQAALGRFFAAKLRAGVAFAVYRQGADRSRLSQALDAYRQARAAWLDAIEHGRVYRADITVGGEPFLRGQWADRLPAIDADLAAMEAVWQQASRGAEPTTAAPLAALEPAPLAVDCAHVPPGTFEPGQPLPVELRARATDGRPFDARLYYRHVNQAEAYAVQPMLPGADTAWCAQIPGQYTASPYPLQYYFVLRRGPSTRRYPDLAPDLANQAYFVVRRK